MVCPDCPLPYFLACCTVNLLLSSAGDSRLGLGSDGQLTKQESCAIAKITAQCAIYMGALKIVGTP